MAHELSIRANGKAEMAYVGELPWHKLGQQVTPGASIGVWQREAGLDWTADEAHVQYHNNDGLLLPYAGRKVIYRSDTSQHIGLVSDDYKVVQPVEVLEFFRDLTETGGWHIHTAGVLRGGSKIWAMASNHLEGTVKKNDRVTGNLLLATSMDGSLKTIAKLIKIRVVCANTLALALNTDDSQGTVAVSHRSYFDAQEVKKSLGVAVDSFAKFMANAKDLADTPIAMDEARLVLRKLFGDPKEREAKADPFETLMGQFSTTPGTITKEQRSVERCSVLFQGQGIGSQLQGSVGTRWGLLNAITQHIDHERGRTNDSRMESAWFGGGETVKGAAYEMLCQDDMELV